MQKKWVPYGTLIRKNGSFMKIIRIKVILLGGSQCKLLEKVYDQKVDFQKIYGKILNL